MEIELIKNSYNAEEMCETLKTQRKALGTQLREAEGKLKSMKGEEEPANKKVCGNQWLCFEKIVNGRLF